MLKKVFESSPDEKSAATHISINYRGPGFNVGSISDEAFCTLLVSFERGQVKWGAAVFRTMVDVGLKSNTRLFLKKALWPRLLVSKPKERTTTRFKGVASVPSRRTQAAKAQ